MSHPEEVISQTLQNRVARARLDWVPLCEMACELVVFGSRAAGVNRRQSDLDVLLVKREAGPGDTGPDTQVGRRGRVKRAGLDLVVVSRAETESHEWLGSELANHVATYGVWIIGSGEWRERAHISTAAGDKKERHLLSLARSVDRSWSKLNAVFQLRYRTTIRRELQRLLLLRSGIPIPPTRILDCDWKAADKTGRDALLSKAASQAGLQGRLDYIDRILVTSSRETETAKGQARAVRMSRFPSSSDIWLIRTHELLRASTRGS